ncbi:uncharacterized protein BXIN_0252 [Babesia sp. Xinjiang]|uniref:uncharacterized protein n=1 Tax=Babesia sp. Xinjiang TaxID=462227 RepID=UPI000A22F6B5|nr:uncharacterized protein BXIN_0252 [Babesia sp. Xinjiang]ORM39638.1 hypothetical protein BXIN_0252 [Babesia sp. Xinjiang]
MAIDSAQKGGVNAIAANNTRKAYDKETFAALVESCSRLFCCDEEIIITDLLLAVEKAVSERDIEAEIGLSERRVHESLVRLERHGLVTKVTTGHGTDILAKPVRQPKSARDILPPPPQPNTHSYWRLSKYFVIAVHYKLRKMEEILKQRRQSLHDCDRFVCHNCGALYDSLDVQKLEMDGFDAHFLCYCGSKVELDVKTLKKCLAAAWGMDVPQFPVYVRNKDKATDKSQEEQETVNASQSAVGAASSVASGGSAVSDISSLNTPRPVVKSLLSDINKQKTTFGARAEQGKIKFHMHGMTGKKTHTLSHSTAAAKLVAEQLHDTGMKEAQKHTSHDANTMPKAAEQSTQVETDEDIMFHIAKLGRSFPLAEAQNHQQHMSNEEFERFLELQDQYLNFL